MEYHGDGSGVLSGIVESEGFHDSRRNPHGYSIRNIMLCTNLGRDFFNANGRTESQYITKDFVHRIQGFGESANIVQYIYICDEKLFIVTHRFL